MEKWRDLEYVLVPHPLSPSQPPLWPQAWVLVPQPWFPQSLHSVWCQVPQPGWVFPCQQPITKVTWNHSPCSVASTLSVTRARWWPSSAAWLVPTRLQLLPARGCSVTYRMDWNVTIATRNLVYSVWTMKSGSRVTVVSRLVKLRTLTVMITF